MEQKFLMVLNIDDHVGYAEGEPVEIVEGLPDDYFTVQDKNGNQWHVGLEEIKAIHAATDQPNTKG